MAQGKFRLTGVRRYISNYSKAVAEKAAAQIVEDLKRLGPYYTGFTEESWVVLAGDKTPTANRKNPLSRQEQREAAKQGLLPFERRITPVEIPPLPSDKDLTYTIANRSENRNIALDLVPGRVQENRQNSAPKDWYATYTQGGGMRRAMEQGIADAGKDRKLRGFKK